MAGPAEPPLRTKFINFAVNVQKSFGLGCDLFLSPQVVCSLQIMHGQFVDQTQRRRRVARVIAPKVRRITAEAGSGVMVRSAREKESLLRMS